MYHNSENPGIGRRFQQEVMERLKETCEVAIHTFILTMNLWKCLRELLFALIQEGLRGVEFGEKLMVKQLITGLFAETNLETVIVQ